MSNTPPIWVKKSPGMRLQSWLRVFAATTLAILSIHIFRTGSISAQEFPAIIGRIEGDDLQVVTKTPSGEETNAAPTVVASGSDVTLRSGHALILLDSGGEISVCGPAHFKMVKASGAVTLALDYGRVHPSVESADTFTIYTPTIVATPISIAGGQRDMTLGLAQSGEMCVLTRVGAMRVVPQFSDQSVIIPQGGTVTLNGGQITSLKGAVDDCSCEFPRALRQRLPPSPASPTPEREVSELRHPVQPERKEAADSPKPPGTGEEPVYTVLMPPLSFDPNAPAPPPDADPETILLVREVRMRSSVVYRGHVNPASVPAATTVAESSTPSKPGTNSGNDRPVGPQPGVLERVRSFIRKLTGRSS